jgi:hypothetical protein
VAAFYGKAKRVAMKLRWLWMLKAQSAPGSQVETGLENKKTTTITSETHEVFIVTRPSERSIRIWCAECAAEIDMLKPEEAAAIAGVSPRTIYAWLEAGRIHHTETLEGNVLVCPKQLFR